MITALSLGAPLGLLALLLVPAFLLVRSAAERRAAANAVRFPGAGVLAGVAGTPAPWRKWLPIALFCAAIAALAFALARPERTVAVADERASLMLVVDASRSMEAIDVAPSRLEAARRAALAFVDEVPERVRLGMVAFSERPYVVIRPAQEKSVVTNAIEALEPLGGTATGDALKAALDALPQQRDAGRQGRPPTAVVLLSDGKSQDGTLDPVTVAERAGAARIPIYTVALGTPEGTVPGGPFGGALPVPPDPETMQAIAEASGGEAFEVDDAGRLQDIYERLGAQLATKREQREITAGVAGAGLVLLLAGIALGLRWNGRLP